MHAEINYNRRSFGHALVETRVALLADRVAACGAGSLALPRGYLSVECRWT
jgi:hypothetical protein